MIWKNSLKIFLFQEQEVDQAADWELIAICAGCLKEAEKIFFRIFRKNPQNNFLGEMELNQPGIIMTFQPAGAEHFKIFGSPQDYQGITKREFLSLKPGDWIFRADFNCLLAQVTADSENFEKSEFQKTAVFFEEDWRAGTIVWNDNSPQGQKITISDLNPDQREHFEKSFNSPWTRIIKKKGREVRQARGRF